MSDLPPRRYWLAHGEQSDGPFEIETIHDLLREGTATWETLACAEGSRRWRPLHEFDEVRIWSEESQAPAAEEADPVAPPETAWQAFALNAGIDLTEDPPLQVANEGAADDGLSQFRRWAPAVSSAYQPSGALPIPAFAFMTLGTVPTTAASALAVALVGGLGGLLTYGIFWLIDFVGNQLGIGCCMAYVLGGLMALVTFGLAYVAGGWAAGSTVVGLGRLGNNRNRVIPAVLGAFSAGLAAWLLYLGWLRWAERPMIGWLGWDRDVVEAFALYGSAVGGLIAVVAAMYFAIEQVQGAKFCEDCERFMDDSALPTLTTGGLRAVVLALDEGRLDLASELMRAPAGRSGALRLFCCSGCGRGYLEATAVYSVKFLDKENDEETKSESWLVASVELDADAVNRFRPWVVRGEGSES